MKKFITSVLFFLATISIFAQNDTIPISQKIQFILVRHAEKIDTSKNPELSEKGKIRAQKLTDLFMDEKIDKLYSTPYLRTEQTIAIIANNRKLEVEKYNPNDAIFSNTLLKENSGKTVLIVGHSNTIPILANFLIGENKYKQLDESEYGKIWIITFYGSKFVNCLVLNY
jgi:broad specificity phosphatase PhoE